MNRTRHAALLDAFAQAWLERDLKAIGLCLHADGVYHASIGPEPGRTFVGKTAVLRGVAEMWALDASDQIDTLSRDFFGEQAVIRWRYVRRSPNGGGSQISLGVDLLAFREGLIILKDAYRKVEAP